MDMIVHEPVLLDEVLSHLRPESGKDYIDATVGQGGHAEAILKHTLPDGRLLGIDRDPRNLDNARARLEPYAARITLVHDSYANVRPHAHAHGFSQVDGILMDIGFSSAHVEDPERGFSFMQEGPLDMRYDPTQERTAELVVNSAPEDELARIFRTYGEERHAREIAKAIYKRRKRERIRTTAQLANLVTDVVPRRGRMHPATQTFQALRIFVNDELGELERALPEMIGLLRPGGRLAVISFHSLEDRIVKRFFAARAKTDIEIETKKPITASREEIKRNPRARSAKLRVARNA